MVITGKQLKVARQKQGINQTDFGRSIGLSRHAVSYWETKDAIVVGRFHGTPRKMCEALGLPVYAPSFSHACAWGLTDRQALTLDARCKKRVVELKNRNASRAAKRRVNCGAKTRKGRPCRLLSELGKRRCKFHGGMSTGPISQEGRERIAEAQRKRWAAYRGKLKASKLTR